MKIVASNGIAKVFHRLKFEAKERAAMLRGGFIVLMLAIGLLCNVGCKQSDAESTESGKSSPQTRHIDSPEVSSTPSPLSSDSKDGKSNTAIRSKSKTSDSKTSDSEASASKKSGLQEKEGVARSETPSSEETANTAMTSTKKSSLVRKPFEYDRESLAKKCRDAGLPVPPDLTTLTPDLAKLLHDQALRACQSNGAEDVGKLGSLYLAIARDRNETNRALECYTKAKELAPNNHKWSYFLGRLFLDRESAVRARIELERSIELEPNYSMAYGLLANLCLKQENSKEAAAFFQKYIDNEPDDAFGYCGLAAAQLNLGETDAAKTNLDKAIKLDPEMGWAHALSARYHEVKGDAAMASSAKRKASFLPMRPGMLDRDPLLVERWKALGATEAAQREMVRIAQMGDVASADKLSEILMAAHSSDPTIAVGLARYQLFRGRLEEATRLAQDASKIAPDSVDVHQTLARCHLAKGYLDSALASAERAVAVNEFVDSSHRIKGETLLALNRLEDAKASFMRAREINPERPETAQAIANIWFRLEEYDKAREYYEKAILAARVGNYSTKMLGPLFAGLGEVDVREDKIEDAVGHFAQAVSANPDYTESFMSLATMFIQKGRGNDALRFCDSIIREHPELTIYRLMRVEILERMGMADRAIEEAKKLIGWFPEWAEAHLVAGRVYNGQQKRQEALASFRKAAALDPRSEKPVVAIVEVFLSQDDQAAALEAAENGLQDFSESVRLANTASWLRATSGDAALRNPQLAIKWGEFACKATDRKLASCLDTLACAYASAGRFEDAIKAANEAIAIANSDPRLSEEVVSYESRLALFEAGTPYIDSPE